VFKGKVMEWGDSRLDVTVKIVNIDQKHNFSGFKITLEKFLKKMTDNLLIRYLFSHEILFIAKRN